MASVPAQIRIDAVEMPRYSEATLAALDEARRISRDPGNNFFILRESPYAF